MFDKPVGGVRYKIVMRDRQSTLRDIRASLRAIDSRELTTDELADLAAVLRRFLPKSRSIGIATEDRPFLRVV